MTAVEVLCTDSYEHLSPVAVFVEKKKRDYEGLRARINVSA